MNRSFLFVTLLIPFLIACAPKPETDESSADIKNLGMEKALEELDLVEE